MTDLPQIFNEELGRTTGNAIGLILRLSVSTFKGRKYKVVTYDQARVNGESNYKFHIVIQRLQDLTESLMVILSKLLSKLKLKASALYF